MTPSTSSIVVFDCETGGLYPGHADILSVGLCRIVRTAAGWRVRESTGWKVQPDRPVDPEAAAIVGYTPEAWADAIPQSLSLQRLREFRQKGERVAAHNAEFDRRFVFAAEDRYSFATYWPRKWICTMQALMFAELAGLVAPSPNHKLAALAKVAGVWPDDRPEVHDSEEDAQAAAEGLAWLLNAGER